MQIMKFLSFEENNFKSKKLQENLDSPITTWKTAKSFMNWTDSAGPPCHLSIAGRLVTKASKVASEMNSFFINKVKLIRENMRQMVCNLGPCRKIMEKKNCQLRLQFVTVEEVKKLILSLSNSRSTVIDELGNLSVKLLAEIMVNPLHHID